MQAFFEAVGDACDRLLTTHALSACDRQAKRRLIGTLLLAPLLLIPTAALLVGHRIGAPLAFALCLLLPATAWIGALAAATQRSRTGSEVAALTVGGALAAATIVLAGGAASPLVALALALPLESLWVARSRRAILGGASAAIAAIAAAIAAGALWPAALGNVSAWHWAIPLAYAATIAPRATRMFDGDVVESEPAVAPPFMGMQLTMAQGGEVLTVQDSAHAPLGLSATLFQGAGLFDRVHVADRVAFLCALDSVRAGKPHARADLRLRLPEAGRTGGDSFSAFELDVFRASTDGIVMAQLRDNSETLSLRKAVADARERADGIDIAKSRFLAAVSHELRTPLNAIIGFSDMLLHQMYGGFTDERQREYSQLIKEAGHHLLSIVNTILDVSKVEAGTYTIQAEPFVFAEAVEMSRSMMALQAERKEIDLRVQVGRAVGEVKADRRAVQQILINLLANAIKFTPEKGSVTVGARRLGSRLHFWVSDTGIGIAAEDLEKLGRPFTQIRNDYTRQFEGTGLGLSLVKGLVALHNGTMAIESAPGEGTKVTISLPADCSRIEPATTPALVEDMSHAALRKTA